MVELSSGVKQVLEHPDPGADVSLIVRISANSVKSTIEAIETIGGVVEANLQDEFLAVTIDEERVEDITGLEHVESIEVEGSGRVLDKGNFPSHVG